MTKATHCRIHFGLQIQRNMQSTLMAGTNRKLKSKSRNCTQKQREQQEPSKAAHSWWPSSSPATSPKRSLSSSNMTEPHSNHKSTWSSPLTLSSAHTLRVPPKTSNWKPTDVEFPYSASSFSDTVSFIYRWMDNRFCIHKESNFQC